MYDSATGEVLRSKEAHTGDIYSVTCSKDGTFIATGSSDKSVAVWLGDLNMKYTYTHADSVQVRGAGGHPLRRASPSGLPYLLDPAAGAAAAIAGRRIQPRHPKRAGLLLGVRFCGEAMQRDCTRHAMPCRARSHFARCMRATPLPNPPPPPAPATRPPARLVRCCTADLEHADAPAAEAQGAQQDPLLRVDARRPVPRAWHVQR